MTSRIRLPDCRVSETFTFAHDGVRYTATVSRFADGSLAEIFLDGPKTGSAASIIATECATTLSIALQYGVPLATLFDALPKLSDGRPAGPLGAALAAVIGR